jgi:hypothetical protein
VLVYRLVVQLGALRKQIERQVELGIWMFLLISDNLMHSSLIVFIDAPITLVPSDLANAHSDPNGAISTMK